MDVIFRGCSDMKGEAGSSVSHFNGINTDFAYFNIDGENSANLFSRSVADMPIKKRTMSSDFDYDRQKEFCKALNKWGFAKYKRNKTGAVVKLLTEYFYKDGEQILIDKDICSNYTDSRHYHHLHVQGLDLTNEDFFKTVKKQ